MADDPLPLHRQTTRLQATVVVRRALVIALVRACAGHDALVRARAGHGTASKPVRNAAARGSHQIGAGCDLAPATWQRCITPSITPRVITRPPAPVQRC